MLVLKVACKGNVFMSMDSVIFSVVKIALIARS